MSGIFVSSVIGMVCAELAATYYVLVITERGKLAKFNPVVGWSNRPDYQFNVRTSDGKHYLWKTNAEGWRRPARFADSPGRRVLIIGDSYVNGIGVNIEERFDRLMDEAEPRFHVLALGTGGWGTDQAFLGTEMYFSLLRINDVLIVVIFFNDFYDILRRVHSGRRKPYFTLQDRELRFHPIQATLYDWLRENIYLVSFAAHLWERYTSKEPSDAELRNSIEIYEKLVARYIEPLKKRNVSIIVAYHGFFAANIPAKAGLLKELKNGVIRTCISLTLACLDLDFTLTAKPATKVFLPDGHWKPFGNRIVSEIMLKLLRQI